MLQPLKPSLKRAAAYAVDCGVAGVAIMSRGGELLAIDGALDADQVRSLVAAVGKQHPDLRVTLFTNEMVVTVDDGRTIYVALAAGCLFVLAVTTHPSPGMGAIVGELRTTIESNLARGSSELGPPPPTGASGTGSPPAEAFVFWPSTFRGRSGAN